MPPPLPPRSPSQTSSVSSISEIESPNDFPRQNTIHLTPQSFQNNPCSQHGGLDDPRTSSTQSLRPSEPPGPNRRILLVIYIHGFMGNETSFRSFPAHVHSLLTTMLAETHVVHTKIYPRYQSRKNISYARDAFSNWLSPHESDNTDVVLAGHSLGGILGAEVVLIPSHTHNSHSAFQHRILGQIAFDTPFLGMHPGVVSTGIASLFRPAPEPSDQLVDSTGTSGMSGVQKLFGRATNDPNFNPVYPNDVNLPVRTNKWEKAWYFMNKHAGDLRKATQSYVKSHLEFGGCLADYAGLRRRYDAIRSLEDIDDLSRKKDDQGHDMHRVRFVNYYTASTGRIKEQKLPLSDTIITTETEMQSLKPASDDMLTPHKSTSPTPRLSLEEHDAGEVIDKTEQLEFDDESSLDHQLEQLDPQPHEESESVSVAEPVQPAENDPDDLPPLPSEPIPPVEVDATKFNNPDALRIAQKDYTRQVKAYEKAKKDRHKAIQDREKVLAKRERRLKKEQELKAKQAKQEEERLHKESLKRQTTLNPEQQDRQMRDDAKHSPGDVEKKKRDRKFCTLPSKDQHGKRDPTWIRVYMEGMDEVVAHTSLFFVSETYAKLVGDVAERIEQWVGENATTRILLQDDYD